MKQTKEQILIELVKLRKSHEEWVSGDTNRRKEFARAFGWNKPKRQYDYGDAELYEPTWVEIFVELWKLLSARNFLDFEGKISELEVIVQNIEKKIELLNNPKTN